MTDPISNRRIPFRWIGTASSAVLLLSMIASFFSPNWMNASGSLGGGLSGGRLWCGMRVAPLQAGHIRCDWSGWSIDVTNVDFSFDFSFSNVLGLGSPLIGTWLGVSYVVIPLIFPLLLIAIPTAFAWWRRRRPRPGHCRSCGYDLTGNVSGVCPECGTHVASTSSMGATGSSHE